MADRVMLPKISGEMECQSPSGDRLLLEIIHIPEGDSWILRLCSFRPKEKEPYAKDALLLKTKHLEELYRFWGVLRKTAHYVVGKDG